MTFDEAFERLLKYEGGYVNDAVDPGGATRYGITEAAARKHGYRGDMRTLPLEVAKEIYRVSYWAAVKADQLPEVLRYAMFDAAVNSGPGQAAKWLQRAVGASADGVVGPLTVAAANAVDAPRALLRIMGMRLEFMTQLGTWQRFGKGWAWRIADIMQT